VPEGYVLAEPTISLQGLPQPRLNLKLTGAAALVLLYRKDDAHVRHLLSCRPETREAYARPDIEMLELVSRARLSKNFCIQICRELML